MFWKKLGNFILAIIMTKISTKILVNLLLNNPNKLFEVRLFITNTITATHFIYTSDMISFIDEGIDGEEMYFGFIEFMDNYKK